uniref:interleukin-1 beta n=1 Tax=Ictidomys tridecemlineatus TaxID=43179 RepID=UPI001A9F8C72|nr:interleukin-1 beta [Ictidomys tridecemlineatus]
MAAVPELASEMMAYHSDENDLFFEVDGPKHMKVRLWVLFLVCGRAQRKGLWAASPPSVGRKPEKKDLCRKIQNSLKPIFCDPWDDDGYEYDAAVPVLNCRLRDVQQKSLVLSDPCELKALHLNGPNLRQQVVFSMSFVLGEGNDSKTPVALGIKGKNLYLTCVMKGDKPTLQLESVDPKSYPKKRMEPRFVFNKIEVKDKVEFESAQFPNWYISTSQAEHLPVFLGNNSGQDITDFTMEFVS